jgi:pseudouridine-5'-phosphate glycosidase
MNKIIELAISESVTQQVKGKALTPFLLKRIVELTDGKSLASNISLVENNVKLAILIAKELNALRN